MRKPLSPEQSKKIKGCLNLIKKGKGDESTSDVGAGNDTDANRKVGLARLRDFVEGDNTLLLTVGRDYPVLPTLAGALLDSSDMEVRAAVLTLLAEFIPAVKRKQSAQLCKDEYLTLFANLLENSAPEVAETVCNIVTQLLAMDDGTKDKFWTLCNKRAGEAKDKPNLISTLLRRNLDAISQLVGERFREVQALHVQHFPLPPPVPPFRHHQELCALAALVKGLCKLAVDCLANSSKRKDLFGNRYGLIPTFIGFMRSALRIGDNSREVPLLGAEQAILVPLAERLAITVGILSKDNQNVHQLIMENSESFATDVVGLMNTTVPWCVDKIVHSQSHVPSSAFTSSGIRSLSQQGFPRGLPSSRPATAPNRLSSVGAYSIPEPSAAKLRLAWKRLLYSMIFLGVNICYGNEDVKAVIHSNLVDMAKRFIAPRVHKMYKSMVSSLVTLKKRHYDVDAVTRALKKVDTCFSSTRIVASHAPSARTYSARTASSTTTNNSSITGSSSSNPSSRMSSASSVLKKQIATDRASEKEESEEDSDEDDFDEELSDIDVSRGSPLDRGSPLEPQRGSPLEDKTLFSVQPAVPSRPSRININLHSLIKYFFINMYNAFNLLIGALNNIDEDIIFYASVVTYKLVHHNPSAQHMFIRNGGLDIVNQLLRDYDLDIQLTGLSILKVILTNEAAPHLFVPEPDLLEDEMEAEGNLDGLPNLKVKVYDSLRESSVPTYMLNIISDFAQLFTQMRKAPKKETLSKDDEKEIHIVTLGLNLLNVVGLFAESMKEYLRELNAIDCLSSFLRFGCNSTVDFFKAGSVEDWPLAKVIVDLIESAATTAACMLKHSPNNQTKFHAQGYLADVVDILRFLLTYSYPEDRPLPLSISDPNDDPSGKPPINDAPVPPPYRRLVSTSLVESLVNILVACVESNTATQEALQNEDTRKLVHALLIHPAKSLSNQGLLLVSHLVSCHEKNQIYFFTKTTQNAMYSMFVSAYAFLRRIDAAPSPISLTAPMKPQEDDDILSVDIYEAMQAGRRINRGTFLDIYSQFYQQVLYGFITLTNLSNENRDIQDMVGKQWICMVNSARMAASTSAGDAGAAERPTSASPALAVPDDSPMPILCVLAYFLQISDNNLQSTALTCINNLALANDDNSATLVSLGLIDVLMGLLPAPSATSCDASSTYQGSGATSVTSMTGSTVTTNADDEEEEEMHNRAGMPASSGEGENSEDGEVDDDIDLQGNSAGEGEDYVQGKINNQIFSTLITLERYACNYLLYSLQTTILPQLFMPSTAPTVVPMPTLSPLPSNSSSAPTPSPSSITHASGEGIYVQLMKYIPILNGLAYMNHANRLYLMQYGAVQAVLNILVSQPDPSLPGVAGPNHNVRLAALYLLLNLLVNPSSGPMVKGKNDRSPMLPLLKQRNTMLLHRVVHELKLLDVVLFIMHGMPPVGHKRAIKHQKLVIYEMLQLVLVEDANKKTFMQSFAKLLDSVLKDTSSVSHRLSKESSAVLLALLRSDEIRMSLLKRPGILEALQRLQCTPHVVRDATNAALVSACVMMKDMAEAQDED